jgi:hypothetical protein
LQVVVDAEMMLILCLGDLSLRLTTIQQTQQHMTRMSGSCFLP